jgi:hypothetical protein
MRYPDPVKAEFDQVHRAYGCHPMISCSAGCHSLARLVAFCVVGIGFTNIATAEVVFGNLGASGTGGLNGTNTDIVVSATTAGLYSGLAQGFTTGSNPAYLTLQSVKLGLFAEPGVPDRFVSIFSNNSGVPGILVLWHIGKNIRIGWQLDNSRPVGLFRFDQRRARAVDLCDGCDWCWPRRPDGLAAAEGGG